MAFSKLCFGFILVLVLKSRTKGYTDSKSADYPLLKFLIKS